MYTLLHLGALAGLVLLLERLLPGFRIRNSTTALLVAVVFSVLNWSLGWLVRGLLFVPAILTLGLLFLVMPLIVNTVMLWLTDKLLPSFEIRDRRTLLIAATAVTLANFLLYSAVGMHLRRHW